MTCRQAGPMPADNQTAREPSGGPSLTIAIIRARSAARDATRAELYERRPAMIRLLQMVEPLPPLATKYLECIKSCGRVVNRWDGGENRRRCGHPLCGFCAGFSAKAEGQRQCTKFLRKFPNPRRDDLSWVTTNIAELEWNADFLGTVKKAKRKITAWMKRHVPAGSLCGGFHVKVSNHVEGLLHLHAWCNHPGMSRRDLSTKLERSFCKYLSVHVRHMHDRKSVRENFFVANSYAANQTVEIKNRWEFTPTLMSNYIQAVESIRGGTKKGRRGLRIEIGLREKKLPKVRLEELNKPRRRVRTTHVGSPAPGVIERDSDWYPGIGQVVTGVSGRKGNRGTGMKLEPKKTEKAKSTGRRISTENRRHIDGP